MVLETRVYREDMGEGACERTGASAKRRTSETAHISETAPVRETARVSEMVDTDSGQGTSRQRTGTLFY